MRLFCVLKDAFDALYRRGVQSICAHAWTINNKRAYHVFSDGVITNATHSPRVDALFEMRSHELFFVTGPLLKFCKMQSHKFSVKIPY